MRLRVALKVLRSLPPWPVGVWTTRTFAGSIPVVASTNELPRFRHVSKARRYLERATARMFQRERAKVIRRRSGV